MAETAIEVQSTKEGESFEHVIRLLEDSRAGLEHSLKGLTDELCSAKPTVDVWSVTEVLEHLVIIEGRVLSLLQTKLPEQEVVPDSANQEDDARLVRLVGSRISKIDAPVFTQPTGQYAHCSEGWVAFDAVRQRTLTYAAATPQYMRGRLLPHPVVGPIDGCQWFLVLAAHTQRHVKQIEEIKAAILA